MIAALSTMDGLKLLLVNPVFLFLAMMFAQIVSVGRQWFVAKQAGATMGFLELLAYWPQLLIGFGQSIVLFVGLVETNTLNFVSATAIGALSNTLTDIFANRRSKAVVDSIPADMEHNARK
jgi:hypothetical protein